MAYRTHELPEALFTQGELIAGRVELGQFVIYMAESYAARLGFGWIGTPHAPNTWNALQAAWQLSRTTGVPLPVFDGATETVILTSTEAAVAYRFWHDIVHLERERNFATPPELDMANHHLYEAEQHGLERGSLPWRLLFADAFGHVLHWAAFHDYPLHQRVFVLNIVQYGIETALLAEASRRRVLAPQVLPLGIDITTGAPDAGSLPPSFWTELDRPGS